mmetsp:Transcript_24729/g.39734  ORF Transcript_24729/g.39734 Transcript_24729/m.39734 type:complete len:246 (-) Transcript_24729:93-830(-)
MRYQLSEYVNTRPGPWSFHGVFDGHGGKRSATFVKSYLHKEVIKELKTGSSANAALVRAFQKIDRKLYQVNEFSGCTAIICLIYHPTGEAWTANVGDSRAVLSHDGKAVPLSKDHKPNRPDELARIKRAGGMVFHSRINGELAVSRAFGDARWKRDRNKLVTAEPEISYRKLCKEDDFIVLACDGLFDVMSNGEVTAFIKATRKIGKKGTSGIAETIVNHSIVSLETMDNVSVCILFFKWNKLKK